MNVEELREYCLSKKAVTESTPFDDVTLVFKVADKMFALLPLDSVGLSINLKCDPERALALREKYPETVLPGYHMNKSHWNTVMIDGKLTVEQLRELIDHSYDLIIESFSKKHREIYDAS